MCHGSEGKDFAYNTPALDGLFLSETDHKLPKDIRRDMLRVEAQEYGLLLDDAVDSRTIPMTCLASWD